MNSELTYGKGISRLLPAGFLVLVMLPLLLLPLASVFIYALKGGLGDFAAALTTQDALFAIRFSLLMAFATAAVNSSGLSSTSRSPSPMWWSAPPSCCCGAPSACSGKYWRLPGFNPCSPPSRSCWPTSS